MITLSTFQKHLAITEPLSPEAQFSETQFSETRFTEAVSKNSLPKKSVLKKPASKKLMTPLFSQSTTEQEQGLLKLLTALPAQAEEQQAEYLEKLLTLLRVANIEEPQRLKLTSAVIDTANQFIATLRQSYIYEAGALSTEQLDCVAQIKSLYYQIIMVYDGVIRRKMSLSNAESNVVLEPHLNSPQKPLNNKGRKRYFSNEKSATIVLATAIYQSLLMYQRLLGEEALCYRQPSPFLWSKINELYHLAHQQHAANIDLSVYTTTKRADDIHQLYSQICLHSLLNLRAMRRPNILLVQRLLPHWAKHMVATIEPKTEMRVFVDLCSDKPPRYLTAKSDINPYKDCYVCLFIELTPMLAYFAARKQVLIQEDGEGMEYWLLNKISMTINYRYLQPQLTLPTQYSAKQSAVLIKGFNDIHYRANHSLSFTHLMAVKELPNEQHPRYDTVRKRQQSDNDLMVEVFDGYHGNDALSLFRTLRLLPQAESLPITLSQVGTNDGTSKAVPPPLHIMSLILVCRSNEATSPDWSIGMVRWLNLDDENPEVEWQVLGHQLVACGLRLESRDSRSRHFVPAFILGQDEQLQTLSTLIVPTAYFQSNDRVVMRINNKQTLLCLGRRLLVTDEFSQYEVVQI